MRVLQDVLQRTLLSRSARTPCRLAASPGSRMRARCAVDLRLRWSLAMSGHSAACPPRPPRWPRTISLCRRTRAPSSRQTAVQMACHGAEIGFSE
jgi:hypothetical protein